MDAPLASAPGFERIGPRRASPLAWLAVALLVALPTPRRSGCTTGSSRAAKGSTPRGAARKPVPAARRPRPPLVELLKRHLRHERENKARLETDRRALADADLQIAATAIHHSLELVTGNLRHFRRIPGLRVCTVPNGGAVSAGVVSFPERVCVLTQSR